MLHVRICAGGRWVTSVPTATICLGFPPALGYEPNFLRSRRGIELRHRDLHAAL